MFNEKNVKVFISSTFKDMHSERDYLVKFVFPTLRANALKLGIHLLDMDLRWGVTKEEAENGKALEICLDEIDHARPFFIGLIGDRYGWMPDEYTVPDYDKYEWLDRLEKGKSITELEITHGIFNHDVAHQRSFFLIRRTNLNEVPKTILRSLVEKQPETINKLNILKEKILSFYNIENEKHVFYYEPKFRGLKFNIEQFDHVFDQSFGQDKKDIIRLLDDDHILKVDDFLTFNETQQEILASLGQIAFDELEAFGDFVSSIMWESIKKEYGQVSEVLDPIEEEKEIHHRFALERTHNFVGREKYLELFDTYRCDHQGHPLSVFGVSGTGKSSLLAKYYLKYAEQYQTIMVFCGLTETSSTVFNILKYLIHAIDQSIEFNNNENIDQLSGLFLDVIRSIPSDRQTIILIDGLDVIHDQKNAIEIASWLPTKTPEHVLLIISYAKIDYELYTKVSHYHQIQLSSLTENETKTMIVDTLFQYRKKLSEIQLTNLLSKKEVNKPLYALAVSQFLRVFPRFEEMDSLIDNLPDDIEGLFELIIRQLTYDFPTKLVFYALGFIKLSPNGLLEEEIIQLINEKIDAFLPMNQWVKLYRYISEYLTNLGESDNGLIKPYHLQFGYAIERIILDESNQLEYYTDMAYYGFKLFLNNISPMTNLMRYTGLFIIKTKDNELIEEFLKTLILDHGLNAQEVLGYVFDEFAKYDIPKEQEHPLYLIINTLYDLTNETPLAPQLLFNKAIDFILEKNIEWGMFIMNTCLKILSEYKSVSIQYQTQYLETMVMSMGTYHKYVSIESSLKIAMKLNDDIDEMIQEELFDNTGQYGICKRMYADLLIDSDYSSKAYMPILIQALLLLTKAFEANPKDPMITHHFVMIHRTLGIVTKEEDPHRALAFIQKGLSILDQRDNRSDTYILRNLLNDMYLEIKKMTDNSLDIISQLKEERKEIYEKMISKPSQSGALAELYKQKTLLIIDQLMNDRKYEVLHEENSSIIDEIGDFLKIVPKDIEMIALLYEVLISEASEPMMVELNKAESEVARLYLHAGFIYLPFWDETKNSIRFARKICYAYTQALRYSLTPDEIHYAIMHMNHYFKDILSLLLSSDELKMEDSMLATKGYAWLAIAHGRLEQPELFEMLSKHSTELFDFLFNEYEIDIETIMNYYLILTNFVIISNILKLNQDVYEYALKLLEDLNRWKVSKTYLHLGYHVILKLIKIKDVLIEQDKHQLFNMIVKLFNYLDVANGQNDMSHFDEIIPFIEELIEALNQEETYKDHPMIVGSLYRFQAIYLYNKQDSRWIQYMKYASSQLKIYLDQNTSIPFAWESFFSCNFYFCIVQEDQTCKKQLINLIDQLKNYYPNSDMIEYIVNTLKDEENV